MSGQAQQSAPKQATAAGFPRSDSSLIGLIEQSLCTRDFQNPTLKLNNLWAVPEVSFDPNTKLQSRLKCPTLMASFSVTVVHKGAEMVLFGSFRKVWSRSIRLLQTFPASIMDADQSCVLILSHRNHKWLALYHQQDYIFEPHSYFTIISIKETCRQLVKSSSNIDRWWEWWLRKCCSVAVEPEVQLSSLCASTINRTPDYQQLNLLLCLPIK